EIARKKGVPCGFMTRGAPARVPSGLKRSRSFTVMCCALSPPPMTLHFVCTQARMICPMMATSLAENCRSRPSCAPSAGPFALVGSSGADGGGGAPLSGVLLRSAAIFSASNCFFLASASLRFLSSSRFFLSSGSLRFFSSSRFCLRSSSRRFCSSIFFCSSAFLCSSAWRSCSLSSSSSFFCSSGAGAGGMAGGGGVAAATSFLGSSGGGGGSAAGGGGGGGAAATGVGFGASFLAGSSCFGLSLASVSSCLALREPWRRRVRSLALTRSTAMGSSSGKRSSRCVWMVKSAHARIAACRRTEVVNPPRTARTFRETSGPLRLGDERDLGEPGRLDPSHHAHHRPVIDALVAADEDLLVVAAFGDGLELGRDLVELDLRLLDEHLARLDRAQAQGHRQKRL